MQTKKIIATNSNIKTKRITIKDKIREVTITITEYFNSLVISPKSYRSKITIDIKKKSPTVNNSDENKEKKGTTVIYSSLKFRILTPEEFGQNENSNKSFKLGIQTQILSFKGLVTMAEKLNELKCPYLREIKNIGLFPDQTKGKLIVCFEEESVTGNLWEYRKKFEQKPAQLETSGQHPAKTKLNKTTREFIQAYDEIRKSLFNVIGGAIHLKINPNNIFYFTQERSKVNIKIGNLIHIADYKEIETKINNSTLKNGDYLYPALNVFTNITAVTNYSLLGSWSFGMSLLAFVHNKPVSEFCENIKSITSNNQIMKSLKEDTKYFIKQKTIENIIKTFLPIDIKNYSDTMDLTVFQKHM
ncbi:hypothetical protein ACFLZV_05025 [Candidatus Margulisiibacteriota bacterium]